MSDYDLRSTRVTAGPQADLASALDRDQTTARNYVNKLVQEGIVTILGDDPNHDGRGRAAKIYAVA